MTESEPSSPPTTDSVRPAAERRQLARQPNQVAVTRVMESLLFGVSSRDPLIFAGVAVGLTVVSLLASLVPALRATRIDPIAALRTE